MYHEAEKWAKNLSRLARGLKDLPLYYKVLSEPNNGGISPERCYEVLKYAHKGLTKGDPEARIIGLNTSKFDWGRQKVVWGLGGLKYVYAVGVHPYCGPRVGSSKPERAHGIGNLMCMLRLDDMIRQYNNGRPKKIWASEVGYDTTPGEPHAVSWEEQANYMARMVIEFKTMDNFGKIHQHGVTDGYPEQFQFAFFTYFNQPKPLAVAYHSIAERMTGVRWLKTLQTPDNVRTYVCEQKDGRQMLVAWSVDGPDRFALPVPCDSVKMMDLMGVYHELEAQNGILALDLTESPVFIGPAKGKLIADRWVQTSGRYREVRPGEKNKRLLVKVRNDGARPMAGALSCSPPQGLTVEPSPVLVDLPPGAQQECEFTLSAQPDCDAGLYNLAFSFQAAEQLEESLGATSALISVVLPDVNLSAARADEAPRLDGKLEDAVWAKATPITNFIDDDRGFLPELDQSLRLLYDLKGLYVGLWCEKRSGEELRAEHTVRDDPQLWADESIEIFLDPKLDRNTYFQLITNVRGVQADARFEDTQLKKPDWTGAYAWDGQWEARTAETDQYWTAEMFIPWGIVGVEPGKKYRMGLNVSRKYAPVGDSVFHSYTPGGVPVHAVGSYLPVEINLTE